MCETEGKEAKSVGVRDFEKLAEKGAARYFTLLRMCYQLDSR